MPITQSLNSKGNVKKLTTQDVPYLPQYPVLSYANGTTTAGQSVFNLGFSVDTTATGNLLFVLDGKILTPGSSNDYTFTGTNSSGFSSQITLNYSTIVAGLNWQAFKLGVKKEIEFNVDNRFVQLYSGLNAGFNGFIDTTSNLITSTTTTGTPVAGTFYSTIIGRASMPDLSQDLKPRFGIEAIVTQTISQLQGEFGASGQSVWSAPNDTFGQVRFVGPGWTPLVDSFGGEHISSSNTVAGDYIEVTFYGTGLNLVGIFDGSTRTFTAATDGGSATSFSTSGYSSVLDNRNYSTNQVINLVSGLALGIHTVTITNTSTANGLNVYGFQIINQNATSSNISVNPGIGYVQGQKLVNSSQNLSSYNSGFTNVYGTAGTTGGRVIVYETSAGAIAKDIQYNATSPSYLTAASHTNEEVVRSYDYREFGANRSDDFSIFASSTATNLTFALDDGTTTLAGYQVAYQGLFSGVDGIVPNTTGSILTFTFVGTGLDIFIAGAGTTFDNHAVVIDGVSAGNITGSATSKTIKIASGLPYGTHVVQITRSAASATGMVINRFTVYQPKTPTLPSGAIQLGSYNLMANYVANTTAGVFSIATGVMRKSSSRELTYSGTWAFGSVSPVYIALSDVSSTVSGNYFEYTFFGTGVELRAQASTGQSSNNLVQIQNLSAGGSLLTANTTNFPSLVSSVYGGFSFSAGTLSQAVSNTNGSGVSLSGLPLSLYKIRVTNNTNVYLEIEAVDVITPIYSTKSNIAYDLQNSLSVGSNALSDDRKTSPIASVSTKKNIVVAQGIVQNPTTSSTTAIPMPDMSATIQCNTGRLELKFAANLESSYTNASSGGSYFQFYLDGQPVNNEWRFDAPNASVNPISTRFEVINVSPGFHKVDMYWRIGISSYTLECNANNRILIVEEI